MRRVLIRCVFLVSCSLAALLVGFLFLIIFISGDDLLYQRMTHHVLAGQLTESRYRPPFSSTFIRHIQAGYRASGWQILLGLSRR